jgi:hypothetical protein
MFRNDFLLSTVEEATLEMVVATTGVTLTFRAMALGTSPAEAL